MASLLLFNRPVQFPTTLAMPGYFARKVLVLAATTRYPPAGIVVLAGKVNANPLERLQPEITALVAAGLWSSTYSSRMFSEEGWYMISLITTACPKPLSGRRQANIIRGQKPLFMGSLKCHTKARN